jgi:hypothetical protein
VVVADDDGLARVEIGARPSFGHITVFARSAGPGSTCVELFANDPSDGDDAEVGVALSVGGDVVATLHVVERGQPALWLDPRASNT